MPRRMTGETLLRRMKKAVITSCAGEAIPGSSSSNLSQVVAGVNGQSWHLYGQLQGQLCQVCWGFWP